MVWRDERQVGVGGKFGMLLAVQHLVVFSCPVAAADVFFDVILWLVFFLVATHVLYHLLFSGSWAAICSSECAYISIYYWCIYGTASYRGSIWGAVVSLFYLWAMSAQKKRVGGQMVGENISLLAGLVAIHADGSLHRLGMAGFAQLMRRKNLIPSLCVLW